MSTVVPFRQHQQTREDGQSWLPMIGLFAISAIITVLAFVGAADLIGRVL